MGGEIVLGNRDWLMTAACSAGPAFEGGGIRWGMRAEEGAIEKISINPDTLEPSYQTVGDAVHRGICGSGMIDLISELLLKSLIDPNGKFKYLGNSSIGGAYMALLSDEYRREAREISNSMTYIDFSSSSQFMDEYTSALFLPHTNIDAFPSVKLKKSEHA